MSDEYPPQAGLVPFHSDAKGLTIDIGMVVIHVLNSSLIM